jgi:K+-sensing histidine kinase KdpD
MAGGRPVSPAGPGQNTPGRDRDSYSPPSVLLRDLFIHELRTPLTVAATALELLRDCADLPSATQEYVGWAEGGLAWLLEMVESIPAWTALLTGQVSLEWRLVSAREWVEPAAELVRPLLRSRDQRLRLICQVPTAPVHGDPWWLKQAMAAMLAAASQNGPQGDTVEVRVESCRRRLKVRVTAGGPGLNPTRRKRPVDSGWEGPGLYLVRTVVSLHGGTLGVAARPGAGITVTVSLPVAGYGPP